MDRAAARSSTLCMGCMAPDAGAPFCPHCGWKRGTPAASILHLAPGTLLHNSYLVGRVLGQGGFGITYLGWDLQLQRRVAIKEYLPQTIASRQPGYATVTPSTAQHQTDFDYGLRSFMSEGQNLARFSEHPCIASVLTLFEENGTGYLVMGYLEGVTLAQSLAAHGGKLPYDTAREIMMRVMDGMREVHALGLLHRDISPENIYLTRQGPVKILDFGAARMAVGERSQSLSVVLREGYAPEEQYRRNGNQGPWTDVYAIAATLYQCITGVTPPPALDRMHNDTLKSPRELGVFMPPEAEAALLRALSVSAGGRFQSVEAFESALAPGGLRTPPPPDPQPWHGPPLPSAPPAFTLFDSGSVGLATFLASPLAGAILMAVNFRRLGKGGAAAGVIAAGVGITGVGVLLGYLLPQYASVGIAIGLLFAMKSYAQSTQGQAVEQHVAQGGRKASRWAAAGIALGLLAAIAAVIFAGAFGVALLNADPKVVIGSKDEVHYTGLATKENAQALGEALKTIGYFSDKGFVVVLSKGVDGAVVSFVVKPGTWDRPEMIDDFEDMGRQVASAVGGFPLQVRLSDVARVTKKQMTVGRVGIGSRDEVYYYGAATEAEAKAAAEVLKSDGYFQGRGATVFLAKNDAGPALTFVVKEGFWESPSNVEGFKIVVRHVAPSVGGLPIELRLMNAKLELKKREVVN